MPRRLRAVGYVRVSTDQQAQEGVSMDAQQVRIRAHCISQEIDLGDIVIDDGYSAKSPARPGIKRALDMRTAKKVDAIVVVKLDRLTRSVKDLGTLLDSYFRDGLPWSLLSVSDSIDTRSAGGKLLLNVLMSVAQWERELRPVPPKRLGLGGGPRRRKEVRDRSWITWASCRCNSCPLGARVKHFPHLGD